MSREFGIIGIVIWALFLVATTRKNEMLSIETAEEPLFQERRTPYSFIFVLVSFLPLIIWAGFRQGYGYVDTNAYIAQYRSIPARFDAFLSFVNQPNTEDRGFVWYLFLIKFIFGENYRFFILITAIFQCLSVATFFRRYSFDYPMSFCLFIISTEYFGWIFNGLRQFMAVCISLYAVSFFLDKRYIRCILIVLLASAFHGSALILLPIGFVVTGKPWNYKTLLALGGGIFAIFATTQFANLLSSITSNTQYSGAVETWQANQDDGANPLRAAVYMIPAILSFISRKKLAEMNEPIINISTNMSIITAALWIVAVVTSGIYMGRLPIYAAMFNYLLLPLELTTLFERESNRRFITASMIFLYLFFYYYQFHTTFGII